MSDPITTAQMRDLVWKMTIRGQSEEDGNTTYAAMKALNSAANQLDAQAKALKEESDGCEAREETCNRLSDEITSLKAQLELAMEHRRQNLMDVSKELDEALAKLAAMTTERNDALDGYCEMARLRDAEKAKLAKANAEAAEIITALTKERDEALLLRKWYKDHPSEQATIIKDLASERDAALAELAALKAESVPLTAPSVLEDPMPLYACRDVGTEGSHPLQVGMEEGDECWRDGCKGVIGFAEVQNCSCHISGPCVACVENPLRCPVCGWEAVKA